RDAEPEDKARGESNPGLAGLDLADEVHRHADDKREQHHRTVGVKGDQACRTGDDGGHNEPGANAAKRRRHHHCLSDHAVLGLSSGSALREAAKNTSAAAMLAAGSNCSAPSRPTRSASQPVTIGPGARPMALLANVSTAKAVPWSAAGVKFATIAPAGPAVAAARNMGNTSSTSCGRPGPTLRAATVSNAEPMQKPVASNARWFALRTRRSLAMPQITMPAPPSNRK